MASCSRKRESKSFIGILPHPSLSVLILVSSMLVVGCASETAAEPTPTLEAEVEQPVPTETAAVVEVAFVAEEDPVDQACIDCHQDKDLLIETADPEEPLEAESSGEG